MLASEIRVTVGGGECVVTSVQTLDSLVCDLSLVRDNLKAACLYVIQTIYTIYVGVLHTSYHSPWRDCHGNCKGNDTIKAYIPTFTCNFVTKNIIIYRHLYTCLVGLGIQYSSILYNSKWIYPCLLD